MILYYVHVVLNIPLLFSGIEPGSVVITDIAVNSFFKPQFEQVILDNVVIRSTELDQDLADELLECSRHIKNFPTLVGHTMCTYDFYEGEWDCLYNLLLYLNKEQKSHVG